MRPTAPESSAGSSPREYRPEELRALCAEVFPSVELLGVFHARALRAHAMALRLGWDRVHRAARITRPFYDRFVPGLSSRDFAVRPGPLDRSLDLLAVLRG